MTKSDVIRKARSVEDIFSFIANLYIVAEVKGIRKIRAEYNRAVSNSSPKTFNAVQRWADEFSLIAPHEFKNWIELWIDELKKTDLTPELFCYITLQKIDNVFGEPYTSRKTVLEKGPLNCDDEYRVYLKPPYSYFNKTLKKGGIRRSRQTVEYDTATINADFNNFEVVKSTHLHDYIPIIKEYNHFFENLEDLNIACLPLSNRMWCEVKEDCVSKEFAIEYDVESRVKHNEAIKQLLIQCEKQHVNIAVFPELAMNPTTKTDIRKFLISSNFKHLKLCYLGSAWGNNTNEACLMSAKGTDLILEKKQIPFRFFSKKEKCYYSEAINADSEIHFVDIPQIGRIVYLICADFNDDSINTVCSVMHANFVFVSAFTTSTTLMVATANALASRRGCSTVLCNSCAAVEDDKTSVAFGVVPRAQDKTLFANVVFDCSRCLKQENCQSCIKIFTIKKT